MGQTPAPPPPPPPPMGPSGMRPGSATGGAIILIIAGALWAILAIFALIVVVTRGGELSAFPGAGTAIAILVVVALIMLISAILQIVGGAQVLGGRRRGRTLGLVGATLGILLGLLSALGSVQGGGGAQIILAVVLLLADIIAVVMLAQAATSQYLSR